MWKNKYVVAPLALVVIVALGLGAYLLFPKSKPAAPNYDVNPTSTLISGSSTTSNAIALNTAGSATSGSSGGLGVTDSKASDGLGEQGQSSSQSPNSQSSGTSSSSSAVNPATFSQYDKYKSSTNALFGDIQAGTGTALTSGHTASVYYKGWLTDGTLFDETHTDSSGNPVPFSFTLGQHQVISGWEEGLAGMKAGGVRLVIVPPSVGYGNQATGSIPADSVLVFEVQLVSVK